MCGLIIHTSFVCVHVHSVRAPRIFRYARKIIKTSTKTSKQDEVLIYAAALFTHSLNWGECEREWGVWKYIYNGALTHFVTTNYA